MTASQSHLSNETPMGATLVADGCAFRVWSPRALEVHVVGEFNGWQRSDASLLVKDEQGFWAGFIRGAVEGQAYKFWVRGPTGDEGFKRDPYARELQEANWNCVIRQPAAYPWHDQGFQRPTPEDLVIYQLHVGVYYAVDDQGQDARHCGARFLNVLDRVEYLTLLGVNAVEPLPVVEFVTRFSEGYNGLDYFSPEFNYVVPDAELPRTVCCPRAGRHRSSCTICKGEQTSFARSSTSCISTTSLCCLMSSTTMQAAASTMKACFSSIACRGGTTTTVSISPIRALRAA
jgi:1,4-alpha-glucan branching enzyme